MINFVNWLRENNQELSGKLFLEQECQCNCNPCKERDCSSCSCQNCECEGCTC